jgi:hypothetical protein
MIRVTIGACVIVAVRIIIFVLGIPFTLKDSLAVTIIAL